MKPIITTIEDLEDTQVTLQIDDDDDTITIGSAKHKKGATGDLSTTKLRALESAEKTLVSAHGKVATLRAREAKRLEKAQARAEKEAAKRAK